MLYKPFHREEELLGETDTYAAAYATSNLTMSHAPSLEDDIHILEQQSHWQQQSAAQGTFTTSADPQ